MAVDRATAVVNVVRHRALVISISQRANSIIIPARHTSARRTNYTYVPRLAGMCRITSPNEPVGVAAGRVRWRALAWADWAKLPPASAVFWSVDRPRIALVVFRALGPSTNHNAHTGQLLRRKILVEEGAEEGHSLRDETSSGGPFRTEAGRERCGETCQKVSEGGVLLLYCCCALAGLEISQHTRRDRVLTCPIRSGHHGPHRIPRRPAPVWPGPTDFVLLACPACFT